jgi:formate dehydrogenase beta subunit
LRYMNLIIDGMGIKAQKGESVLNAALKAGIYIPHLCHHPDLPDIGACRLCVVEIDGVEDIHTSCSLMATNGMVIRTKSERLNKFRRLVLELILSCHVDDCTGCSKYLKCELQSLIQYLEVSSSRMRRTLQPELEDTANPLFIRDKNRCILCGRCVRMCNDIRGVKVLDYRRNQDGSVYIGPEQDITMQNAGCRFCCGCVEVCPTGALRDKEGLIKTDVSRNAALVPCREECPAHIDIPRYIRYIRKGDYSSAIAVIREKAPFPLTLGYICTHVCENVCRRKEINESVSIRELKRFAGKYCDDQWKQNAVQRPPTGKKVAVLGAGPAGLTSAYYLQKLGHAVTVFETLSEAGGMLRVGIPEYRLPLDVLQSEINEILSVGIELKTNARVESIDELFSAGFDSVVIAVGTHQGMRLPIPGAQLKNVYVNTEFLRSVRIGKPLPIGETVTVLGGGNVAFDCARTAIRLGAKNINLVCLEQRNVMLADEEEISQSLEEGVKIYNGRTFLRIIENDGVASGVECMIVKSFFFDENKRLQLIAQKDTEQIIEADTVIFAIGQKSEIPEGFGLESRGDKSIIVDGLQTSRQGVFACGDVISGTASVIKAIASGRNAAIAIDKYLGGDGNIQESLCNDQEINKWIGREEGFANQPRHIPVCREPEKRKSCFMPVDAGFEPCQAAGESQRCLQCDLRLAITKPKFWAEYTYK